MQKSDQSAPQQTQETDKKGGDETPHNMMVVPKFIAGLRTEVKQNIFFLNETTVLYPVGHNIVILNTEDKSQKYIPGTEGAIGISALAVSQSKKYLAVSEQTNSSPVCSIYHLDNLKKIKTLTSNEISQNQFVSVAFAPTNEKMLVTLTEPQQISREQQVLIWQWDKPKCLAYTSLPHKNVHCHGTQVSFCNADHNQILVSGFATFMFFKLQEVQNQPSYLKIAPNGMHKKDQALSSNYTVHCWLPDHTILVGTDQGDIIICWPDGSFKLTLIQENQDRSFVIHCIRTYNRGFIVGGTHGQILLFERGDDPQKPYVRVAKLPQQSALPQSSSHNAQSKDSNEGKLSNPAVIRAVCESNIQWLDLSKNEEHIIFSTGASQLFKMKVNMDRPTDGAEYDYLVYAFHNREINGLDVCIRKNLIATCGTDKTVKIWSYSPTLGFNLEINYEQKDEHNPHDPNKGEEALSVAFHPSGFQVVVGFSEKIRMMNLFQDQLIEYRQIQIKECREIQFSNGGHLFAAVHGANIKVFKFYTGENPPHYNFKSHMSTVLCISWLEDDSGFVSSALDSTMYLWKLNLAEDPDQKKVEDKENMSRNYSQKNAVQSNPIWGHNFKPSTVLSVATYREDSNAPISFYMICRDRSFREFTSKGSGPVFNQFNEKAKLVLPLQTGPIAVMHKRKALFLGQSKDAQPGSIHCYKYPFEKTFECQAHSKATTRIRLSYDNTTLFSVSLDGSLCVFNIMDKDPKRKIKDLPQIQHSGVLLIQRSERDKLLNDVEHYKQEIKAYKEMAKIDAETKRNQQDKKIDELIEEIELKQSEANQKYESTMIQKNEIEMDYENRISVMKHQHEKILEENIKDQQEKVNSDQQRYMELQQTKEQQCTKFEILLTEIFEQHTALLEKMHRDHQLEKDALEERKKHLAMQIEEMITEHQKVKELTEQNSWKRIDHLKSRQKEQLSQEIDKGMQQKSELSIIHTDYKKKKAEKEEQSQKIQHQHDELLRLKILADNKKDDIKNNERELQERIQTMHSKSQKIQELKARTIDLEKYKFVLDYKIKELKREIPPRADMISRLSESTTKMEQEVKFFQRVNTNMMLIVADMEMRSRGLQNEKNELAQVMSRQKDLIRRFEDDTTQMIQMHIGDFKKLKQAVIRLYKTYSAPQEDGKENQNPNSSKQKQGVHQYIAEMKEHIQHKEGTLEQVRSNLTKKATFHRSQFSKIQKENITLLMELNSLRKEQHQCISAILKKPFNEKASQEEILEEKASLKEQYQSIENQIDLMQQQHHEFEENLDTLRRMVHEHNNPNDTAALEVDPSEQQPNGTDVVQFSGINTNTAGDMATGSLPVDTQNSNAVHIDSQNKLAIESGRSANQESAEQKNDQV